MLIKEITFYQNLIRMTNKPLTSDKEIADLSKIPENIVVFLFDFG